MRNYLAFKKVVRYFIIYGIPRTIVKLAGRTNSLILNFLFKSTYVKKKRYISLIGCGQFGFSTISYFLQKKYGNVFLDCFDINKNNTVRCSKFWEYTKINSVEELIKNPQCKYIYIASDHYSHTDYAIKSINAGKTVYIEKPISVNFDQYHNLINTIKNTEKKVYVGYNRPFSKAIKFLNKFLTNSNDPYTISCFIYAHFLESDHWYRQPEQGTRICGNVGHWIDLSINILNNKQNFPSIFYIDITYSNLEEPDDNISINITTEQNDLINILITSYSDPFEGINETINIHHSNIHYKIDDFRRSTLWIGDKVYRKKYFPKDVGHKEAILQPFKSNKRDFLEIEYSTLLMLHIADMVKNKEKNKTINLIEEHNKYFN